MALTENGNGLSAADIAAVTGNGNGFGNWGDGSFWIIVLFLFALMGNGWNGFGGNGGGSVQQGFDQQAVMNGLNGLTAAVSNGFANAEVSRCNAQANVLQNLNAIGTGIADLKYTVATENCADRTALNEGIAQILANQNAGIQTIIDKMCQQEIDQLKTQNANLQTQINLANLSASQTAQTARILADNAAQTQALEQYLNPAPIPAYVVQNPNCCHQNWGYACGSM